MPYIFEDDRDRLDHTDLFDLAPDTAGELNYAFTTLALNYLGRNPSYQSFNDVVGALEGAKLELYRRKVAPYEDTKKMQNGDVYD
jgi:hypothetical protein